MQHPIRGWPHGRRQCSPGFGFPGVRAWQWANGHGLQALLPPPVLAALAMLVIARVTRAAARLAGFPDMDVDACDSPGQGGGPTHGATEGPPAGGAGARACDAEERHPRPAGTPRRRDPDPRSHALGATGEARAGQSDPAAPTLPTTPPRSAASTTPLSAPPRPASGARTPPPHGGAGIGSPAQAPAPPEAGGPRRARDTPGTLLGTPVAGDAHYPAPLPAPDAGDGPRRGGRGCRRPTGGRGAAASGPTQAPTGTVARPLARYLTRRSPASPGTDDARPAEPNTRGPATAGLDAAPSGRGRRRTEDGLARAARLPRTYLRAIGDTLAPNDEASDSAVTDDENPGTLALPPRRPVPLVRPPLHPGPSLPRCPRGARLHGHPPRGLHGLRAHSPSTPSRARRATRRRVGKCPC